MTKQDKLIVDKLVIAIKNCQGLRPAGHRSIAKRMHEILTQDYAKLFKIKIKNT